MKPIAERFADDTTEHAMTVLHDDDEYVHLLFKAPNTSMYWFELMAWPGTLAIRGDMGSFMFARVRDMLGFFRGQRINPQYWAEKEVTGAPTMTYSPSLARRIVKEYVSDESLEWRDFTQDEKTTIREEANRLVRGEDFEHMVGARTLIDEFEVQLGTKSFRFSDAWEWSLEDYTVHYLWCCHAIVWGIRQYDASKVPA